MGVKPAPTTGRPLSSGASRSSRLAALGDVVRAPLGRRVGEGPMFYDAPILHPIQGDAIPGDRLSGGCRAAVRPLVRAGGFPMRGHLIALGDQGADGALHVGERFTHFFDEVHRGLAPLAVAEGRMDPDEIGGENLVGGRGVAIVPEVVHVSLHHGLRILSHVLPSRRASRLGRWRIVRCASACRPRRWCFRGASRAAVAGRRGAVLRSREPNVWSREGVAMPKDLRTFLDQVAHMGSDEVRVVSREIEPQWGATAVAARLEQQGRFPALVFRRVRGSQIPVVLNLTATYERLALSLDTDIAHMVQVYGERQAKPIRPVEVDAGPVHDVVLTGADARLDVLPILTHNALDAGAFVAGGGAVGGAARNVAGKHGGEARH